MRSRLQFPCLLLSLLPAVGAGAAPLMTLPRPVPPIERRLPVVTPLERSTATDLALTSGARPPEDLTVVRTKANGDHVIHATAYIHAPVAKVWAALRDPEILVSRRRVDHWHVASGVDPRCDMSYRITQTARSMMVSVDFDITWRLEVVEGTPEAPKAFVARGSKTGGTSYIHELEDSIVARDQGNGVTRLEIVRHQNITMAGFSEAEDYVRDLFASLKAKVHGEPLPDLH